MKLIKLAAAALITLSSLTAQAAIINISGGDATSISSSGANHNYFRANNSINALSFNVGGNLLSGFSGTILFEFTYLGAEANWENQFVTSAGTFTNAPGKAYGTPVGSSFVLSKHFSVGEDLGFSFKRGGTGATVVNGANNAGDTTLSFATLLTHSFNAIPFDAILFFDDTGGWQDDDNHDDLVVGVKVLAVPESSTLVLMMMGLLGVFAVRRMKA